MRVIRWQDLAGFGTLGRQRKVVIGVPNTGRLLNEVVTLMQGTTGLIGGDRGLWYESDEFIAICARSTDLPYLATHNLADVVLTGYDYVVEADVKLEEILDTGFQRCVIGIVGKPELRDWQERPHLRVATQYPGIATQFFTRPGSPECHLLNISGAAELYVRTGMVDVAVDAYMTGRTARANGLELLTPLFETSGRVFARPGWQSEPKDITRALEVLADIK
ncbi:ATP phosphoribosyltransferase [Streptomyces tauricus]|uniref:ATP phosphoribosyltransferase n=1 Tax=Streptomyces tauricus TaxID=68274 RepID=A0ABZ1JPG0_9ACTN|nr:ATP phosphoribosyltransferase [Streptomyces tauricus]